MGLLLLYTCITYSVLRLTLFNLIVSLLSPFTETEVVQQAPEPVQHAPEPESPPGSKTSDVAGTQDVDPADKDGLIQGEDKQFQTPEKAPPTQGPEGQAVEDQTQQTSDRPVQEAAGPQGSALMHETEAPRTDDPSEQTAVSPDQTIDKSGGDTTEFADDTEVCTI